MKDLLDALSMLRMDKDTELRAEGFEANTFHACFIVPLIHSPYIPNLWNRCRNLMYSLATATFTNIDVAVVSVVVGY